MVKTDKEFRSMKKQEVVEYAKSLEQQLLETNMDETLQLLKEANQQLELTQAEAVGMSETIRLKNAKENAAASAIANLINGIQLAIDNASTVLENYGIVSKGGR